MEDTNMYEDITAYDLDIKTNREISLPQEVAQDFGNELVIISGKEKLSLYTSSGWEEKEEELTKMIHDKPEYAAMLRVIISSGCDHTLVDEKFLFLEANQLEHIGVTCPGTVTLLKMDDSYSLVHPKTAQKLHEEIEEQLFD